MTTDLPDIQETKPEIEIPICQVGVENIEVPFQLESKYGGFHQLVAKVSMRTNLDEDIKGISMSRLLLTLNKYLELPLKHKLIKEILDELMLNLGTSEAYMKFDFHFPIKKKSILSNNEFPIYYKCKFEGQRIKNSNDSFRFLQGVTVQYASYCPCSAELCNDLHTKNSKGFPHAQRSFAHILVETIEPYYVWLESIIESVESAIKTLPYPIIKRIDEQEIARIAAENPIFVEDAIRAISKSLDKRNDIHDWIVKCIHEESIHTSEAIAVNWKGIPNGFNGDRFI